MGIPFSIGVKTTIRQGLVDFAISAAYLAISYYMVGFKTDQLFLIGLFNLLYFLSPVTRKFILGFSIFKEIF